MFPCVNRVRVGLGLRLRLRVQERGVHGMDREGSRKEKNEGCRKEKREETEAPD